MKVKSKQPKRKARKTGKSTIFSRKRGKKPGKSTKPYGRVGKPVDEKPISEITETKAKAASPKPKAASKGK
jgi:hypothetical protein